MFSLVWGHGLFISFFKKMENIFDSRFEVFSYSEFEVITAATNLGYGWYKLYLCAHHTDTLCVVGDSSIFRRLFSPNGFYSERCLLRKVFIPKGRFSKLYLVLRSERFIIRRVIAPKNLIPKCYCSERFLIRKVFIPKGSYPERFLIRTVLIPKGHFSEIRNKNLWDQKPFGSKIFMMSKILLNFGCIR